MFGLRLKLCFVLFLQTTATFRNPAYKIPVRIFRLHPGFGPQAVREHPAPVQTRLQNRQLLPEEHKLHTGAASLRPLH